MPEVRFALGRDRIATLTVDTAGPVNTIGARLVTDFETVWRRAEGNGAIGVIVRSGKARSFLDGANLKELRGTSPAELRALLLRYQGLLEMVARSPLPVVGLVEKATALGGGFELLLWACDHVVATPGSRLGLPEVNVGLFPAGGGTHTLRRVLGLERALELMARGRVLPVEEYVACGLVTVVEPADAERTARDWLIAHPRSTNRNLEAEAGSVDDARRVIATYRQRQGPSPCKPWFDALFDSVESGLGVGVSAAAAADLDRFVSLWQQPTSRNTMDFFLLSTSLGPRLARVREEVARPVASLAVFGAGLMGRGIAQVAADAGLEVVLLDVSQDRLDTAITELRATLDGLVAKGRWSERRRDAVMGRISPTLDYGRLAVVPLVVEAVFEDVSLKRSVLERVEEASPQAIFASNTSTLPMQLIAERSAHPERVVGMHFFSPVPLMQLLEVIRGPHTGEEAVATAVAVGRRLGKTCILVNDGPGFYTSRCFGTFVLTGITLVELGMLPQEVDRIAVETGFPQGPLHVYGSVGGAVVYHAGGYMAASKPYHQLPATLERLYAAGYTGAGKRSFYRDERGLEPDPSALEMVVRRSGPTPSDDEARDMLMLGMANEAFRCLEEGVLADIASMELGAVLGVGFPSCWHGPARFVSLRGVRACRERLAELHERFRIPQLSPCRELDRLIACGVDAGLA